MSATRVAEVDFTGGGVPVVIPITTYHSKTQVVLGGIDTSNAVIELLGNGATAYETLITSGVHYNFMVTDALLSGLRITVASTGTYKITIWQFK